ncbi:hypothetical protein LTR46_006605 [Exophiala xenobiotica]|nr:hypothetical protein LTR46_006605 [Exophiala xenobiotica]
MAPTSVYQAAQIVDRLLVNCAEATESLKQLSGGDDDTYIPKNELRELFPIIERHLLYAITLLLSRHDPLRQPFRSPLEESWIDTILRCCSNTLYIIHYNLRNAKSKTSSADADWDEAREFLEVQDKNLKHLTDVLKIQSDSKLPYMHILNAIDKQALRSSQIQQKIKETGKATLATNGEPVKTVRIIDANLTEAESTAEASEPFPPNERQKNVKDGSARNDEQSGFAEYDRGFKDGREHACSLLKSIGLFEFEPPNGNRITWLRQAIEKNSVQAVELLLDMGTNINQESPLEDSKATTSLPLFQAAESRCSDIVKLLLERGANVQGRNSSGWTVLHAAAKGGDVSTIQLLLKQYNVGIEVRSEGEKDKGFTPLMIAVEHGKEAAIRHLKRSKANIKATDDTGQGLLHLAVNRKDLKTIQLLVDLGVQTGAVDDSRKTPLHRAATKGYEEIAGLLIKETPGLVNSENQDRETPLHSATKAGRVNILELLLQNGARVDLPNNKGATALHLAVRNGHAQAVERLLKNNAGPNVRDASDRAPLHTAIWFGKNAMITLLLDNNADINQVGNFGMPPLHLAAWVQDFVAVQELFERGASPSTRIKINGKGEEKTAKGVLLSIAREKRKPRLRADQ